MTERKVYRVEIYCNGSCIASELFTSKARADKWTRYQLSTNAKFTANQFWLFRRQLTDYERAKLDRA